MMINFRVDRQKTLEALVYVAAAVPNVSRFHAAKILYFADVFHLNAFGRPVTGDRYIAMDNGPVPSFAYDALKGRGDEANRPYLEGALRATSNGRHPTYHPLRDADLSYFSKSDLDCLNQAIEHCRGRSFGDISDETHDHKAWKEAGDNGPMSFHKMLDGASPEMIEDAQVSAAYGAL